MTSISLSRAKLAGLALGILFALCMTHFTLDHALADSDEVCVLTPEHVV